MQQFLDGTCCSTYPSLPTGIKLESQTDKHTEWENRSRHDWNYKIGDQVLLLKDGILRKGESWYESDPWTITSVHTNGTIRVQRGTKSERLNIRRVTPFFNNQN